MTFTIWHLRKQIIYDIYNSYGSFGNLRFGNILIPAADDFDLEYHKAQENFEYNHRTGQSISLKTK